MCAPQGPEGAFELRFGQPQYPDLLMMSPEPPRVLYGVGRPSSLLPGLAIVGSRNATPYGISAARRFASWCAAAGVPVISGAARGCDQAAHLGALASGGTTVAVLGCGADVDYPRSARRMLESIRQRGAVVSELEWGTQPQRWTFARRNRIIAALSVAVLVVEARLPSGTFSTADAALEAGREVYAVPGSIYAPECRGPNRLLRQGATPITDVSELAAELRPHLPFLAHSPSEPRGVDANEPPDRILSAIRTDPARPDDLARALDMDVVSLMRHIAELERAGRAVRFSDGRYGSTTPGR